MTVSQMWEFRGTGGERLYSRFISDADWLSTKRNVLSTFGGIIFIDGVATNGNALRIIETQYDPPGDTVFELAVHVSDPGSGGWSAYRSERVPDLYPERITLELSADQRSPVQSSSTVRFTATASGGSGIYDYQFWVKDSSGNKTLAQDYGNGDSFDWTPGAEGRWVVQCRTKNFGSPGVWEAVRGKQIVVASEPPVESVAITSDIPSPVEVSRSVTLTAAATGGSGSYDYEFWVRDPSGARSVAQAYGGGNTFLWTPSSPGRWLVQARAKNLGSPADWESFKGAWFVVTANAPVDSVRLSADTRSPASVSSTIHFTALASGGTGNYDYQFWAKGPGAGWTLARDYGGGNTFAWMPASPGNWVVQVRSKNLGSGASFEAFKGKRFTITP